MGIRSLAGRLGKAGRHIGGKVKGSFAKLRDRSGKFAYSGGKKRKGGLVKYKARPSAGGKGGFKSAAPAKKFTISKLGKAARYVVTHPRQAKYFLDNHYLAKSAKSRLTLPFRNARDTIGLNLPKGIRSRNRLVNRAYRNKILKPTEKFRKALGAAAHKEWSDPGTRFFAGVGVLSLYSVVAQAQARYNKRSTRLNNK